MNMTRMNGQPSNNLSRKQIIEINTRRFQLLKKLGEGGTGSVWLAKNLESSRGSSYAVKIMYLDVNDMTTQSARREVENMFQLNHPSLIKLLDAERKLTVNKRPSAVLVMECAPRGDLFDYIRFNKGLRKKRDSSAVHRVFTDMVYALEHMHEKGICHRDIKPENIIFDYNYNARLADFGFSKVFRKDGKLLKMTEQLGSRGYHAPEITSARHYSETIDIFSLGVVLFIMYAGAPPFKQVKSSDWWFQKLATGRYDQFWAAHERGTQFSTALKRLLEGMLCVNPKHRITLEGIKRSVWFNKKIRMSDQDYRHYMHSIYKRMHPKCSSATPQPKGSLPKEEAVPKVEATPKVSSPTVEMMKAEDSGPAHEEMKAEDSAPPPAHEEEVKSADKSPVAPLNAEVLAPLPRIFSPAQHPEKEKTTLEERPSLFDAQTLLNKQGTITTEFESAEEIRSIPRSQSIKKYVEELKQMAVSVSGELPAIHNRLNECEEVNTNLNPTAPASKTPILSIQDVPHAHIVHPVLGMMADLEANEEPEYESSEEEDDEEMASLISKRILMATPGYGETMKKETEKKTSTAYSELLQKKRKDSAITWFRKMFSN